MTDKQIIIDGVDITKCEFCDYKNYEYPMCEQKRKRNELNIRCELRQNCYYKQLKAKEQECEKLQTEFKNFEEQIKLQNNFIDSLFKATNNSKWLDKSMLDDEVSEVIEKIELDYEQLDQLKAENEELKKKLDFQKNMYECARADESDKFEEILELKQTLEEIKSLCYEQDLNEDFFANEILQKISEVEDV